MQDEETLPSITQKMHYTTHPVCFHVIIDIIRHPIARHGLGQSEHQVNSLVTTLFWIFYNQKPSSALLAASV